MREFKMTNNDKIPELTKSEFESFSKQGLVLVVFVAEWCMPCMMMAPIIDEMSEKFRGKIKFGKVNVDENQEIAQRFNVRSIPTFVLFNNGEILEQFTGAVPEDELDNKLKSFLK